MPFNRLRSANWSETEICGTNSHTVQKRVRAHRATCHVVTLAGRLKVPAELRCKHADRAIVLPRRCR